MLQQIKNIYHLAVALLASCYFGFPARSMTIIGVTGTDGKTTTASLIYHILAKNGKSVALISTVGAIIKGKEYDTGFHVTTPSSIALQSYLKKAKNAGVRYVVLEVTSHALDQNRILGIPFAIGVITNISHEHLDYHKTYEKYLATKAKLAQGAGVAILNKDDNSYSLLLTHVKSLRKKIITYGMEKADVSKATIASFKSNIPGEYNRYNVLAATAVCLQLGIEKESIRQAIASFILPKGRTEIVYSGDFMVMIDFAHTPNAFRNLLKTLKKTKGTGRLIHVFGAAGMRDSTKRRSMGEVASEYDDVIILTAEDPRTEQVTKITEQIASGIIQVGDVPQVVTIPGREKAILHAIQLARKNDVVVVTGKGHERSMNYGNGEVAWSDYEAVTKSLSKRYEK